MSVFKYTIQHGLIFLQCREAKYVHPSCGQRTTDAFSKNTGRLFFPPPTLQAIRLRIVLLSSILTLSKFGISAIPLEYDLI